MHNISFRLKEKYKGLNAINWDDVPGFSVLTGPNGSGKTQLLEALAFGISQMRHSQSGEFLPPVEVLGDSFAPGDISFLSGWWTIGGSFASSVSTLENLHRSSFSNVQRGENLQTAYVRRTLEKRGIDVSRMDVNDFLKKVPNDYDYLLDGVEGLDILPHIFVSYRLKAAELRENQLLEDRIVEELGLPPWTQLNDILKVAEFPYEFLSPKGSPLQGVYELLLTERPGMGARIRPMDLSSGEKMLLRLAIWLYQAKESKRLPRLLLLDEPDAHLHPTMTRHFLNILQTTLVEQHNVRVVMSTHSPSTIALSPKGSVFELHRGASRISASPSNEKTTALLTAGFVVVSSETRYVLVEDQVDAEAYTVITEILMDQGPGRDQMGLDKSPSIVYLPVSTGEGRNKIGGGCTVVLRWATKLSDPPLSHFIKGLIDRDEANLETGTVRVIGRYSIENYLLDPIIVFGLLLSENKKVEIGAATYRMEEESALRNLPSDELQKIANWVFDKVRPHLTPLIPDEEELMIVRLSKGQEMKYPVWLRDRRGHDLMNAYQSAFNKPKAIHMENLLKSLRRVRIVPQDLAVNIRTLQA